MALRLVEWVGAVGLGWTAIMRVLLIEDDRHLGDTLQRALVQEGYVVDWLTDAEQADVAVRMGEVDLMILDRRLPGRSGVEWLRDLRGRGCAIPVLMLTALSEVDQRVVGLDAGADDYLAKPFDLSELLARLRALSRRGSVAPSTDLVVGNLRLDRGSRAVFLADEPVELTVFEVGILEKLMDNQGRYVSKAALVDALYGLGREVTENAVEAHVSRLRKRIGKDRIRTLRGGRLSAAGMSRSLRRRLVVMGSAWGGVVLVMLGLAIYHVSQAILWDVTDARLRAEALTVAALVTGETQTDGPWADYHYETYGRSIQVWVDGEPVLATDRVCCERPAASGWSEARAPDGTEWRIYGLRSGSVHVVVAQDLSVVFWLSDRLLVRALLPFLLILPVAAGLLFWAVGRALRPLDSLAEQVAARSSEDLSPLAVDVVAEVEPLVDAFNGFARRLGDRLHHERGFTANAAHELLTPLAAIKSEAQLARRTGATDPSTWQGIEQRVDRASHLVEQLVALSRVDHGLPEREPVDLGRLLQDLVAEHGHRIDEKGLDFELELGPCRAVQGAPQAIRSALRNLLDNALGYVPERGKVRVALQEHGNKAVVAFESSGDTIPESLRTRLFERFVRGPGEERSGSGLGLSIVQESGRAAPWCGPSRCAVFRTRQSIRADPAVPIDQRGDMSSTWAA